MKMMLCKDATGAVVQAHRFSGGELVRLANWVDAQNAAVKTCATFSKETGGPVLILETAAETTVLDRGDWLVRSDDNTFRVMTHPKFCEEYTPQQ